MHMCDKGVQKIMDDICEKMDRVHIEVQSQRYLLARIVNKYLEINSFNMCQAFRELRSDLGISGTVDVQKYWSSLSPCDKKEVYRRLIED
mgnify:CR=1 FL=1